MLKEIEAIDEAYRDQVKTLYRTFATDGNAEEFESALKRARERRDAAVASARKAVPNQSGVF